MFDTYFKKQQHVLVDDTRFRVKTLQIEEINICFGHNRRYPMPQNA